MKGTQYTVEGVIIKLAISPQKQMQTMTEDELTLSSLLQPSRAEMSTCHFLEQVFASDNDDSVELIGDAAADDGVGTGPLLLQPRSLCSQGLLGNIFVQHDSGSSKNMLVGQFCGYFL